MKSKEHRALVRPVLLSSVSTYFKRQAICDKFYFHLLPELVPPVGKKFTANKAVRDVKDAVKKFSMNADEKTQFLSMSLTKLLSLYDVEDKKLFYYKVSKFEEAFGKDISDHFWNQAVALAFCTVLFFSKASVRQFLKLVKKNSWLVKPGKKEAVELLVMYVYSQFISNLQTEAKLTQITLKSFQRAAQVLKVREDIFIGMFEAIADYYEKDYRHLIAKEIRYFISSIR